MQPSTQNNQPASPGSAAPAANADVSLIYDDLSLSLLNISDAPINLADLTFQSERGTLSIYSWDNGYLSASLSGFPAGDCLQAWNANTEQQPKPPLCDTRHAWIGVSNAATMWAGVPEFSVYRRGNLLATCAVNAGECSFSLP
jgi:hypothetical protein